MLGRCTQFFRQVQQNSSTTVKILAEDMLWKMLVAGWKDSHKQHDVYEFIAFMEHIMSHWCMANGRQIQC